MQLAVFVVGAALLIWIIVNAAREGDWRRIAQAPPGLIAVLLGCTLISTLLNGASFWVTVRPIRHIRFADLQRLNVVANMLNYAPIRLGAFARVIYHMRVDKLRLLEIGAWFTFLAYMMGLGIGSALAATLAHPRIDWAWALLVGGTMVGGTLSLRVVSRLPLLARYGQGLDRMVGDPGATWSALAIRAADLGAYTGRMAAAVAILGIDLKAGNVVVLAMVALSASLIPFGRVGFREFCVAAAGLTMAGGDVENRMNQLALVESAGEALVFLPLGLLFLPWLRSRLKRGSVPSPTTVVQ